MRRLRLKDPQFGDGQRLLHQENELENAPIVPVPVEYEDIDKVMIEFCQNAIKLTDENGKEVPTFKLLSNQRFSEYSQSWSHTDNDGNLLMNFKTINREINPSWGTIHSGMANIPGDNRFTVTMREIIDDTGVECYEITSMSQPLSVDLKYTITFVTSKIEQINDFNVQIINLFKSKQCYIYPNGHAMPIVLDNIGDESRYEINDRKFYNQPVTLNLMAYIIPKDDIKVELKPKRVIVNDNMEHFKRTYVDMEYVGDTDDFSLNVRFNKQTTKVSFTMDEPIKISLDKTINAKITSIKVNDEEFKGNDEIVILPDEQIMIKIVQPSNKPSTLVFKGTLLEGMNNF